jgi:hypothetical protein
MMRVECHHSGALMVSAIAEEDAPRFAWILHTGRNRPAGKASLNSLDKARLVKDILTDQKDTDLGTEWSGW